MFPGTPLRAHWGLPDPAAVTGSDSEIDAAFAHTWDLLEARVRAFLALPFEGMERRQLTEALAQIGEMEGAA